MKRIETMRMLAQWLSKQGTTVQVLLATVAVLLASVGFVRNLPTLLAVPAQVDFAAYYLAGTVLNRGQHLYDETAMRAAASAAGVATNTPYIYPPLFAILFRPVALVPYATAAAIWFGLNVGLAIATMIALGRTFRLSKWVILVLTGLYLILPATGDTLLYGQFALAMNALLVGVLILSARSKRSRRNDVLAGILLGAASIIKVYPLVLGLVYLLHRRFSVLTSTAVTILVLLGVGIGLGGWEPTLQWFTVVLPSISGGNAILSNQSVWAVAQRLLAPHHFDVAVLSVDNMISVQLDPLINAPAAGTVVTYLCVALLVLASAIVILRMNARQGFGLSLSVGMALMLLISPIVWEGYLVHLVIPLMVIAEKYNTTPYRIALLAACLFMVLERYWRFLLLYVSSPLLTMFGFTAVLIVWFTLEHIAGVKTGTRETAKRVFAGEAYGG